MVLSVSAEEFLHKKLFFGRRIYSKTEVKKIDGVSYLRLYVYYYKKIRAEKIKKYLIREIKKLYSGDPVIASDDVCRKLLRGYIRYDSYRIDRLKKDIFLLAALKIIDRQQCDVSAIVCRKLDSSCMRLCDSLARVSKTIRIVTSDINSDEICGNMASIYGIAVAAGGDCLSVSDAQVIVIMDVVQEVNLGALKRGSIVIIDPSVSQAVVSPVGIKRYDKIDLGTINGNDNPYEIQDEKTDEYELISALLNSRSGYGVDNLRNLVNLM